MINPQDLIREHSVEEFCEIAENYFKVVSDPTPLMSKPFTFLHEAPEMLQNMGLLLSGLHLGKTMTVLDFGAGTCWFSRFLNQLLCQTICCDVSKTALDIGRKLFEKYPPMGRSISEPVFLFFDGHRIDLPEDSVDRIICFDAFHHIPNPEEVLSEFARVLKSGGLAGFSEPGRNHSQTSQSQYEMKNHRVLENDIRVNDIFSWAQKAGFTDFSCKLLCDMDVSLEEYNVLFDEGNKDQLKSKIWNSAYNTMFNKTIFFLHKGKLVPDSRSHIGLAHSMNIEKDHYSIKKNHKLELSFKLANTGRATWLNRNIGHIGIVRLASHLYDEKGQLLNVDFSRDDLPASVKPGETIRTKIFIELPDKGTYRLAFDLVAEAITWFENVGSKPLTITVEVK